MMPLPLWYFVMHFIVVTPGAIPPVEANTKAFFFRNKSMCHKALAVAQKRIHELDIEVEPGKIKVILGTKCRQAKIGEEGLKRDPSDGGIRVLDHVDQSIRAGLWGDPQVSGHGNL